MGNCVQITDKGISYSINSNIELISVVMLLSNYYNKYPYLKTNFSFQYVDEILLYFNDFRTHPVIKKFEKLVEEGFDFDIPLATIMFCNEEMTVKAKEIKKLEDRLCDVNIHQINIFLELLHDFSKVSCFGAFFQNHEQFYDYIIRKNMDFIPNINFKDMLTEYYGVSPKGMEVVLAVTFGGVGFSVSGSSKTSIVLGTFDIQNNTPIIVDKENFIKMMFHEFSHSFINQYIDCYKISSSCSVRLYNPLYKGYKEQYGNGKSLISEQVVRAVTARFISIYVNEEQGKRLVEIEKNNSFIAVEPIYQCLLNKYESNRDKYQTFKAFMPQLIEVLEGK